MQLAVYRMRGVKNTGEIYVDRRNMLFLDDSIDPLAVIDKWNAASTHVHGVEWSYRLVAHHTMANLIEIPSNGVDNTRVVGSLNEA